MPRSRLLARACRPLAVLVLGVSCLASAKGVDEEPKALSYGGGSCGKLEGGVALPCSGENYEAFTSAACAAGRVYLHPLVQATIVDAYGELAKSVPERRWQYGEMGLREGGRLWPHRTHQNGLAADFFVPMSDDAGGPRTLPISATNRFGYDLELDRRGKLDELTVDWEALGRHLLALEDTGRAHGVKVVRVILTPDFHERLFKATPELRKWKGRFMTREAWVRHDEHYHVDFEIPKALRRPLKCDRGK